MGRRFSYRVLRDARKASMRLRGYEEVSPADIEVGDRIWQDGVDAQIASINREMVDQREGVERFSFDFYVPIFVQAGQVRVEGLSVPPDSKMWRKR